MEPDIERYRNNWQNEVDSAAQYHAMAEKEADARIKAVYENLAKIEETHVKFWEGELEKKGWSPLPRKPSWRARLLIVFAKFFGPGFILPTIAEQEKIDRNVYTTQAETQKTSLTHDERLHAEVLKKLVHTLPRGIPGNFIGRIEGRHKALGGNALRASVLGANDGLCSNLSLVMGIAGASTDSHTLILTGLAGLFAGACSMALGEWLSVTSSRELAEREIRVEAEELAIDPQSENDELRLIFEAKGIPAKESAELAAHLMKHPERAIETLAREELGIDPSELTGSAKVAASYSFIMFALGAIIPVIPFFFFGSKESILVSVILSGLALFGIGAMITIFTGRSAVLSGCRQLLLGGMAATITHLLGRLIGGNI